ncbi:MAG: aminotransferase class V-fold PLP-dependent enzyme [Peptostreptococcaceae bacterium]
MIYLDNAATTLKKPDRVYDAVNDCLRNYCANPGRGSHKLAMKALGKIYETRENLSKLFNVDNPMSIVFTSNATEALNLSIKGFLKSGDHVITTSIEHNSVIRPIKNLEKFNIENTIVKCDKNGFLDVNDIEKAIKKNTKLIVTTHASNVCGSIIDIKSIGNISKKYGIKYLVDASQTAGVYDIDVLDMNIDMLAVTGHKNLFGIQGSGILYVNKNIELDELKQGGTGSSSLKLIQPNVYPDKYESGTPNTPAIVSLNEGVKFILETTTKKIREKEEELCEYMIGKLLLIDGVTVYGSHDSKKRSSVISINIDNLDSGEISFILDNEFDILTRPGIHCSPLCHETIGTLKQGAVRFSIGYFNTKEEIDKTIEALKSIKLMLS